MVAGQHPCTTLVVLVVVYIAGARGPNIIKVQLLPPFFIHSFSFPRVQLSLLRFIAKATVIRGI